MFTYWKAHKYPLLFAISSLLFYISFAYDLDRTDTVKLIGIYIALFYFFYKLIQFEKGNFKFLLFLGVLFRFVFIIAIPNLSQDFYRFIWDGRLITEGINPFIYTPEELISTTGFNTDFFKELYNGMGTLSASHYSNYPPVNQFFFYISNLIGGNNILVNVLAMRVFIVLADVGILYFGMKILAYLKLPKHQIFWYFLNPFIIIELTGNLHFEGVMLFFFIVAIYALLQQKWILAAFIMGISISIKLIPLIFLPFFIRWFIPDNTFNVKAILKTIAFYSIIFIGVFILFIPFLSSELITHYSETIGLWFHKFEFNASFYYIIREIGYYLKGYNIIETAGFRMAFVVLLFTVGIALVRKNYQLKTLLVSMLMAITFYYSMSTTIHPWYVATPLLLCVFTNYKFPVLWSLVIVLSYITYANIGFKENLWIITIEYLILYGYFLKEVYLEKPILKHL